jgi:hypothetical protein
MVVQLLTVAINCCNHIMMCWFTFANSSILARFANAAVSSCNEGISYATKNATSWEGEVQVGELRSWLCAVVEDGTRCLVLCWLLSKNWWRMRPNQHDNVVRERGVAVPCCYGSLALWRKREQPPWWRSRRHGSGGDAGCGCLFCDGSVDGFKQKKIWVSFFNNSH